MIVSVTDYISVAEKLASFGMPMIAGMALLPENFEVVKVPAEFRQQADADTLKTLLRINHIPYVELFDEGHQPHYIQSNSFEWFGFTLFIEADFLSKNTQILAVVFDLLSHYLHDQFKGEGQGVVSLNIIYENRDGFCKKIAYKGYLEGLKDLASAIANMGA
jgi:hypothetical protein